MKVLHVGTLPIERMGVLTRILVSGGAGEHRYMTIEEYGRATPGQVDVVVLHCFKASWEWFRDFLAPAGAKLVSFVHSTTPCVPAAASDAVVALTHASADQVRRATGAVPLVISGALEDHEEDAKADLDGQVFGIVTRNAPGKLHPLWNEMAAEVLEAVPGASLHMIVDNTEGLLEHPRATYDTTMPIGTPTSEKLRRLRKLAVAVLAHGDFEETFCVAALECMAAGLPVLYLYQPALREVIGDAGVCFHSIDGLKRGLLRLLADEALRVQMAFNSLQRAEYFSRKRMLLAWDRLLEGVTR
ncbi:MAG: glycosyltransferase [Phycisphaerales bacterium]